MYGGKPAGPSMRPMVPYVYLRRHQDGELVSRGRVGSTRANAEPRPPTTMLVWHSRRDVATSRTASVVIIVITRSMRGLVKKIQGVG
jgi:hypothetical protein